MYNVLILDAEHLNNFPNYLFDKYDVWNLEVTRLPNFILIMASIYKSEYCFTIVLIIYAAVPLVVFNNDYSI